MKAVTGGFGRAPYGATERCTVRVEIPNWMWETHVGGTTGKLRWSSLWGHEALYWVGDSANLGIGDACG
eukprot:4518419-Pyramimonas_sp.AAC.1